MSRRHHTSSDPIRVMVHTFSFSTVGQTTLPEVELAHMQDMGATHIGLFIVGGGGAGMGDGYRAGCVGGGGTGGSVFIKKDILLQIMPIVITVGGGGVGGTRNTPGNNGGLSKVEFDTNTYEAYGGWGGYDPSTDAMMQQRPRLPNSGYGGAGGGYKESTYVERYYNTPFTYPLSPRTWTIKGEEGMKNPFDSSDNTVYGSGGGAGYNSYGGYDLSSTYPNYGGTGAGRGGYGANNAGTNRGGNATSYGSGGGGAAFSSNHRNSLGGNGMQGVVRVYFYKYV